MKTTYKNYQKAPTFSYSPKIFPKKLLIKTTKGAVNNFLMPSSLSFFKLHYHDEQAELPKFRPILYSPWSSGQ